MRIDWRVLFASLLLGGCVDSPLAPMPARTPPHISRAEQGHDLAQDAESLLALYETAFESGDYRALAALHDPAFSYDADGRCRLESSCAGEFPWGRAAELRILQHLLNPEYVGPGPAWLERWFDYSIQSVTVRDDGDLEVQAVLNYSGMTEYGGVIATVLATLTLHEGRDGGRRLLLSYEHSLEARKSVPACWSVVKCRYWP